MVDSLVGDGRPWVVDSGPLSHFAKAGWLGLFKLVAAGRPVVIPDVVHQELLNGERDHPHLRSVLDATSDWIEVRSISRPTEMVVLARYASALVGADGRKNLGESGVLALAEVIPGVAILREAATDADVVVFSPPFEQIARAAELVGPLADKILVDTTNPFNPERTGLVDLAGSSSLAIVARHLPGSRLVKALHSLGVDQARAAREAVGRWWRLWPATIARR